MLCSYKRQLRATRLAKIAFHLILQPNTACIPSSLRSPALQRTQCGASVAGQASWSPGANMALGFVRFVGESRPASRRYPLQGATRSPDGDDVPLRSAAGMLSLTG